MKRIAELAGKCIREATIDADGATFVLEFDFDDDTSFAFRIEQSEPTTSLLLFPEDGDPVELKPRKKS